MKLKSSLAALLGLLATLTLVLSHSFDNADIVAASGTDFLVDKQSPSPFAPGHKKTSKRDGTGPGNDENDYNRQNPLNPIPDNVVMFATVTMQQRIPRTMFNRTEIWQALNQGFQFLQDAAGGPGRPIPSRTSYATYASTNWPFWEPGLRFPDEYNGGGFGLHAIDTPRANQMGIYPTFTDIERVFIFPITWRGFYDGAQVQPGIYRVVFTDAGVYLGVVYERTELASNAFYNRRYSWLTPVDANANSAIRMRPDGRWNYPGIPEALNVVPPPQWNTAEVYRAQLDYLHGQIQPIWPGLPPGSGGKPSQKPSDGQNSTANVSMHSFPDVLETSNTNYSIWDPHGGNETYHSADWNDSIIGTFMSPSVDVQLGADCEWAVETMNNSYLAQCTSLWYKGWSRMQYRISLTATGQDPDGWCRGIIDNAYGTCGGNFHPHGVFCWERTERTIDWFAGWWAPNTFGHKYGIDLIFELSAPWAYDDADHLCIADAIDRASCAAYGIHGFHPTVCRRRDYFNSSLTEEDWGFTGPP